ncbi:hypothetical protein [Candidatus Leptofilum sp.]|uniref:hypothetical protein n=1 Tax=Candidatus Leptofilum sp. TaxID=3241576 RepID=UPI003B5AB3B9
MGSASDSVLLGLALVGLIVVGLYALRIKFLMWQLEKALQIISAPRREGGSILRIILFILVAIIFGLVLFG